MKSMERNILHGLAGLVFACICLYEFFTICCFGLGLIMMNSYCSRNVGSDAQICYPSSL